MTKTEQAKGGGISPVGHRLAPMLVRAKPSDRRTVRCQRSPAVCGTAKYWRRYRSGLTADQVTTNEHEANSHALLQHLHAA